MKKAVISLLLALSVLVSVASMSGCTVVIPDFSPGHGENNNNNNNNNNAPDKGDGSKVDEPDDGIDDEVSTGGIKEELEDSAMDDTEPGSISAAVAVGKTFSLSSLLPKDTVIDTWESACAGIVSVSGDTAAAVKCGRTEIIAKDALGKPVATVTVTVEFPIANNNGYTFPTIEDTTVHKVTSLAEADRIVDKAVANHVSVITLDFSAFGSGFNPFADYRGHYEFGNHVSFTMKKYDNAPQVLYLIADYNSDAATVAMDTRPEYDYSPVMSGNAVIRDALNSGTERADDYEGFKINFVTKTLDVYNSEELWWAVEHGYKPIFPMENSKAELFYERAKMILRDIITDDMSDFDKVVAIYEYLVYKVSYDYDSFYSNETNEESKKNVCYYLEGVFENAKAVCDGKSKALVLLCGIEGINCVRDFGDKGVGSVGHAWNYVELDGKWYMVDTTKGDVPFGANSSVGTIYGKSVEAVDYVGLLVSVDFYRGTYDYSRLWEDISNVNNGSLTEEVFAHKLGSSGYDFEISSQEEMNAIIAALVKSERSDCYFLSLVFENRAVISTSAIFNIVDNAFIAAGVSSPRSVYRVFESAVGEVRVVYITIHSLSFGE